MFSRAFAVAIFMGSAILCEAQGATTASPRIVVPLQPLLEVLDRAKVSGTLEVSGHCGVGPPPHLPHLRPGAMRDGSSLQLVREMFANNPAMQVVQDPDGKIRMNESGVPAELLQVKIRHISFEENGVPLQYAAFSANTALLHAILRSPEIVTFMKSQGMVLPFGEGGTGGSTPHPISAPHIVGSMDDLTLSEALDRVLRTFPGVWVYENCPRADERGRFVFLRFFDLQHPGLVEEE